MLDTRLEPMTSLLGGRRLDDSATESPGMGKEWRRDGEGWRRDGEGWRREEGLRDGMG